MTFSDLQPNQFCTFIHTLDATLGLEDVCIGIRSADSIRFIYTMGNYHLPLTENIDGEYLKRKCRFISPVSDGFTSMYTSRPKLL